MRSCLFFDSGDGASARALHARQSNKTDQQIGREKRDFM